MDSNFWGRPQKRQKNRQIFGAKKGDGFDERFLLKLEFSPGKTLGKMMQI